MKTITTNIYTYNELLDYAKIRAVRNFKTSGFYQYAYTWSDEKAIKVIIEEELYFKSDGDPAFI